MKTFLCILLNLLFASTTVFSQQTFSLSYEEPFASGECIGRIDDKTSQVLSEIAWIEDDAIKINEVNLKSTLNLESEPGEITFSTKVNRLTESEYNVEITLFSERAESWTITTRNWDVGVAWVDQYTAYQNIDLIVSDLYYGSEIQFIFRVANQYGYKEISYDMPKVYYRQAEYAIVGSRSDGSMIEENNILFVDDTGSLRIINDDLETVSMQSVTWRMEVLNRDSVYVPLLLESVNNVFDFDLAEDNLVNKFYLKRFSFENDYSVYFKAKVICIGKTADNVDINLEFPLLLNFLPAKTQFEIIDYNFTIGYDSYIQLKYKASDNTNRLELYDLLFPGYGNNWHARRYGLNLEGNGYLHYTNIGYPPRNEYFLQYLILIAYNTFGVVNSDTIYVHDLITSIKDFPARTNLLVYPNPASDYIYLQGEDIQNIKKLTIRDTTGKTRKEVNTFATDKVDISELPQGIYILNINYKNNRKSEQVKLIKN